MTIWEAIYAMWATEPSVRSALALLALLVVWMIPAIIKAWRGP